LGENKKKNRPGQRARKQKALMLEAKKLGKPVEILTFREKKEKPRPGKKYNNTGAPNTKPGTRQKIPHSVQQYTAAIMDKSHHPSWAAKQAQKDKEKVDIHAFSGKRVVFDD
jgi:hypothetical protein